MSKIIKNVKIGYDGGGMACGPVGGAYIGEMMIDHDGRTLYVSGSDIGEDAVYFITEFPMYETLLNTEESFDDVAEKEGVLFYGETGPVVDYDGEDEMAESDYYNCIKYLRTVIRNNDDIDPVEVTDDYGKDIDQMEDLPTLASYDMDEYDDEEEATEEEIKLAIGKVCEQEALAQEEQQ